MNGVAISTTGAGLSFISSEGDAFSIPDALACVRLSCLTHVGVPDALLALGGPPSHAQIHPQEATCRSAAEIRSKHVEIIDLARVSGCPSNTDNFKFRATGGVHSIGVNFRKSKKHPDVSAKCTGVKFPDAL